MYVELDLPEPPDVRESVSEYWSRYLFAGSPSNLYQVNALATTFMRLAEAAIEEYKLGAQALRRFWAPDRTNLELSSMHRAIFHFESSLSAIHRAVDTYRRLRNHKAQDSLIVHVKALKPTFVSDRVANRFREARDVIQHLSEMVMNGQVAEGQPVALKPEGPKVPHPSEPGQTVKTFDRLVVGPHEIYFRDVVFTLNELASAATHIAQFDRRIPPATHTATTNGNPTYFENAQSFRQWLERHAATTPELIVGFHKVGSGKPSMTWSESVDEALCFGWIDAVRKRIDDASYQIRFTHRKPTSIWSAVNIAKYQTLDARGLVTPAGAAAFAHRREERSIVYAYEQENSATLLPQELREFRRNAAAWKYWQGTPPGYQKQMLHRIATAKKAETRAARLAKLIALSAAGKRWL